MAKGDVREGLENTGRHIRERKGGVLLVDVECSSIGGEGMVRDEAVDWRSSFEYRASSGGGMGRWFIDRGV
jgi:hypothetical protein